MPKIIFRDRKGDIVKQYYTEKQLTAFDLYRYVVENMEESGLPAGWLLALYDHHHKTYYPLHPRSDRPIVQYINKGGGADSLGVHILSNQDVKHTTLGGPLDQV